ncbi:glycosyl transferase family protein [Candidatus Magnetobacterium bavaricum]|uniref:Glycosyl transferase family protein n=1 Tax=Candidatus Magnetobacterium bavaricum TaxID=29290 RepID=A0A0F3GHF0_9BACT|nr:glycosyl transferase family protein [Candidatus Magnetobacterium bavaricum]
MITVVFIVSLLILAYIFIGYPLIILILSIVIRKEIKTQNDIPYVSIIISAYNEENIIREKIENCLDLDYPKDKLEIIVASESIDKTNKIVNEYRDKGVVLYAYENREGKRATLFKTVALAKNDIIVFSDANAMYKKDAIRKLIRAFSDERIGCVSGRLVYTNPKNSSIGKGESTYWEYDFILKMLTSKFLSLGGGVNGSIFGIRKHLYSPIDKYRGDDFEISCRVEINGYGVVLDPEAISYEESSEYTRQEFSRKVRLATWNLKSSLMLLKEAITKKRFITALILFSHRFLRYTTPVWLISLLICNAFLLNSTLVYFLFLQILFYLMGLIGMIMDRSNLKYGIIFLFPFYFIMVNYAALIAIVKNILGRSDMLWEKVR